MEIDTNPEQPDEVVRAILAVVGTDETPVDPWWQAGIDEALEQ